MGYSTFSRRNRSTTSPPPSFSLGRLSSPEENFPPSQPAGHMVSHIQPILPPPPHMFPAQLTHRRPSLPLLPNLRVRGPSPRPHVPSPTHTPPSSFSVGHPCHCCQTGGFVGLPHLHGPSPTHMLPFLFSAGHPCHCHQTGGFVGLPPPLHVPSPTHMLPSSFSAGHSCHCCQTGGSSQPRRMRFGGGFCPQELAFQPPVPAFREPFP